MSNSVSYQTIYSNQIYLNSNLADIKLNGTYKSNVAFFFKDVLKSGKSQMIIVSVYLNWNNRFQQQLDAFCFISSVCFC